MAKYPGSMQHDAMSISADYVAFREWLAAALG
ncbi:hypothetical protein JOF29_003844 [Kribbella aluminosa]|uniref:Uncharacterized protein n=1 Tax=Kribbella aluminosa TaxID=416017 RepID=A0ABS4UM99_9ACTN|nr:hypothetical protein [Kribbella aluminosa]